MTASWRRRVLLLAIVLALAVGVAAGIAAWRPRAPIARWKTSSDTGPRDRGYWRPHFLDDATLALLHPGDDQTLSVELWSVETGTRLLATKLEKVFAELPSSQTRAVSPWLGDAILLLREDVIGTVDLWSARTGKVARTLKVGPASESDWPPLLEFSRSADLVAQVASGTIEVRATATGDLVRGFALPGEVEIEVLCFSPQADLVVATDARAPKGHALLFSIATGKLAGTIEVPEASWPAFTSAGELLVEGDDGNLSVFARDGKLLRSVVVDKRDPSGIWFRRADNPLGDRFCGFLEDHRPQADAKNFILGAGVFDLAAGRLVATFPFDDSLRRKEDEVPNPALYDLSPSGERLAVIYRTGDVLVYEVPPP
jgi:WD40 repeat protein